MCSLVIYNKLLMNSSVWSTFENITNVKTHSMDMKVIIKHKIARNFFIKHNQKFSKMCICLQGSVP